MRLCQRRNSQREKKDIPQGERQKPGRERSMEKREKQQQRLWDKEMMKSHIGDSVEWKEKNEDEVKRMVLPWKY